MKINKVFRIIPVIIFIFGMSGEMFSQSRTRIVSGGSGTTSSQSSTSSSLPHVSATKNPVVRPVMVSAVGVKPTRAPLVQKIVLSTPTTIIPEYNSAAAGLLRFNKNLRDAMSSRLGIPYVYGSDGPRSYDCSGLIWSVFEEAGQDIKRNSAHSYWQTFEPVYGDDRYKFGTLVFFNGLAHVGIVVDENTFYHASSSKGVTYSQFAGYWEKRIDGFRRIPLDIY